jgi:hypothetical protein
VSRLCAFLELLEPDRQPVRIWTILSPSWQSEDVPGDPLEAEFEERAIMNLEWTAKVRAKASSVDM